MVQELGETREDMTRGLMKKIEKIINEEKSDKFWILIHAKPMHFNNKMIKQKIVLLPREPPMMLACLCFEVDKHQGTLKLLWAIPGDWPTYTLCGTAKPVPEVVASYDRLEKKLDFDIRNLMETGMGPAFQNEDLSAIYKSL
jgi:hypothetical protein